MPHGAGAPAKRRAGVAMPPLGRMRRDHSLGRWIRREGIPAEGQAAPPAPGARPGVAAAPPGGSRWDRPPVRWLLGGSLDSFGVPHRPGRGLATRVHPSRGRTLLLALSVSALLATPSAQAAPDTSLRPLPRPAESVAAPAQDASPRPEARTAPGSLARPVLTPPPAAEAARAPQAAPGPQAASGPSAALGWPTGLGSQAASTVPLAPAEAREAVAASIRPEGKPGDIAARARAARAALASPPRRARPDDTVRRPTGPVRALCGSPSIVGENLAAIPGRLRGCGVAEPVRVAAVEGVRLSRPAVMDCRTARTLAAWVEGGVKPAVGRTGGGVAALQVAAGYACRTRNNRPGARISEHGRGRAIDVSAFVLADGRRITVLEGWRRRGEGRILRAIHAAACGPFGTVLGPDGDRYHQDHLHLDTTPRRSTAYCR